MQLPSPDRTKKIKPAYVFGGLFILLLVIGLAVGLFLSTQSQDNRQQASVIEEAYETVKPTVRPTVNPTEKPTVNPTEKPTDSQCNILKQGKGMCESNNLKPEVKQEVSISLAKDSLLKDKTITIGGGAGREPYRHKCFPSVSNPGTCPTVPTAPPTNYTLVPFEQLKCTPSMLKTNECNGRDLCTPELYEDGECTAQWIPKPLPTTPPTPYNECTAQMIMLGLPGCSNVTSCSFLDTIFGREVNGVLCTFEKLPVVPPPILPSPTSNPNPDICKYGDCEGVVTCSARKIIGGECPSCTFKTIYNGRCQIEKTTTPVTTQVTPERLTDPCKYGDCDLRYNPIPDPIPELCTLEDFTAKRCLQLCTVDMLVKGVCSKTVVPRPRPTKPPTLPVPVTGEQVGSGTCASGTCSIPTNGCVALHSCDELWDDGQCTVTYPSILNSGSANAQAIANATCKCVQVDALNGANNSCTNGHINGDYSTLVGHAIACPNNGCNPVIPLVEPPIVVTTPASPGIVVDPPAPTSNPTTNPTSNPTVSPTVRPTVSPTASPRVSPIPTASPTPVVCGGTCSFTSQCPQNHTCNSGRCELTACVNGSACTSDRCRVTACGNSCSSTSDCPSDHSCNGGRCVLNACANGSSCTSDRCRVTGCTSACVTTSECPSNHTCSNGVCRLTQCVNGASCDSNQCTVTTNPSPVATPAVGCNDPCVNNSDCRSSSHICVDTVNGRRCRYEHNITSDSCAGAPVVAQSTPQPEAPEVLPTAGSNDILTAVGSGAAAIILGIVGFLML